MKTFEQVQAAAQAGDAASQDLLAQALEQMGRIDEALAWWMQAAKSGFPAAHAKLGLWQLVGFKLPQNSQEGVTRIAAAAQAGDLLGLSLASVIDAGGIGAPRDVARALKWLTQAAAAGDAQAACQLGLLVGLSGPNAALARTVLASAAAAGSEPARRALGSQPFAAGAIDWAAVVAAVDLSAFETPLTREDVRAAPAIAIVPDLLPGWVCDYVMAMAEPALRRGMVVNQAGGESVEDVRSNRVMNFGLADSDVVLELVNSRIAAAAGMPAENAEGLGVLHYAPGERYAPHVDYIPDTPANAAHLAARGQRVRTVLVYLNEGFDGGATEFPRLELGFKPARGSALIFDSVKPDGAVDPTTLHMGAPPTRGEKWIISKWFRTKALRPGSTAAANA
ncbi:2OG-Fe(II) oxygenase [Phenylobacterium sp.]|uniref:2OG-Fe(II) oxygenase n=1 Tax=Phenylobacterium sp. TaxID=1871053 RepID=UPI002FC7AE6E